MHSEQCIIYVGCLLVLIGIYYWNVILADFLKAPLDLTVDCHNNSVSLSWTPPQSFAPISSFSIRTSIAPTNETIISGKRRNFSIDLSDYGISRCEDKKITFMVGGINDLGNGKYSSYTLNSIKIDGQENCNRKCAIYINNSNNSN